MVAALMAAGSLMLALAACSPAASPVQAAQAEAKAAAASPVSAAPEIVVERDAKGFPITYSVVAYGYNYTDLYIDSFEVDGAGGGNLAVSTSDSGGGGHACCARITSGIPLGTTFTIKWTRDREQWCEIDVPLTKPVPKEPRYLEVHFYPDGMVEIEATQKASKPRLALDRFSRGERKATGNVNNDDKYARCKNGYR
jgi:Protein of unknown function (DUF3304)